VIQAVASELRHRLSTVLGAFRFSLEVARIFAFDGLMQRMNVPCPSGLCALVRAKVVLVDKAQT